MDLSNFWTQWTSEPLSRSHVVWEKEGGDRRFDLGLTGQGKEAFLAAKMKPDAQSDAATSRGGDIDSIFLSLYHLVSFARISDGPLSLQQASAIWHESPQPKMLFHISALSVICLVVFGTSINHRRLVAWCSLVINVQRPLYMLTHSNLLLPPPPPRPGSTISPL